MSNVLKTVSTGANYVRSCLIAGNLSNIGIVHFRKLPFISRPRESKYEL